VPSLDHHGGGAPKPRRPDVDALHLRLSHQIELCDELDCRQVGEPDLTLDDRPVADVVEGEAVE
jgi:hypothetical protein